MGRRARVRFFGNVEIGRDIAVDELRRHYDAVVYAYGAALDRRLGIPGENLPGVHSATDFVTWYSGHPDTSFDGFALQAEAAVVVGAGNVALDVARMMLKDVAELASTDIPSPVLEALRASKVTDVHLLARRGPAQAKFTHKELSELGELRDVDVVVDPADLTLGDHRHGPAPELPGDCTCISTRDRSS